jgi:hypothetical protein
VIQGCFHKAEARDTAFDGRDVGRVRGRPVRAVSRDFSGASRLTRALAEMVTLRVYKH